MPGLNLARWRVTVEAKEELVLPGYLGSTLGDAVRPRVPGAHFLVFGQWTHDRRDPDGGAEEGSHS